MSEHEKKRLLALQSYQVMDSDIERSFDDLTKIASEICQTPIALISLVDDHRQWFKSRVGLEATETPREIAFCQHAILGTDVMEVQNATKDYRFNKNPLVTGEPNIRFYAGAPLIDADGFALGTLCVIDRQERALSDSQKESLKALSRQVIVLLEARKHLLESTSLAAERAQDLLYLFKSLPQIIWTADASGAIDLCNEKWTALTGLTYEQTMGEGWLTAVHPDDVVDAVFKWNYSLKTETIYTNEIRFLDRSGEYRWFLVRGVPVKEGSEKFSRWFGTCTDITESKNAQNEKNEYEVTAKSAIESSRLKTEFLANMSHEIRTPINGIIGMTNLLAESKLNAEQQNFTNAIMSSSKILLTLINDILDITKIEAGKLEFEEVPFDLLTLLNETKVNFENQLRSKNIEFKYHFDFDSTVFHLGDPSRIQQIINNLLSNATKFTQSGFVSFKVIQMANTEVGPYLHFEIQDTGIGIRKDILPKLFTNFSQADASMSRKFGGSGLGLAISRQLVQHMGGDMQVKSREQVGSTFTFSLCMNSVPKPAIIEEKKQKVITENEARAKFRVLVAEDNMINQEITLRMLRKAGYRAEVVANGKEAVAAVETMNYDLILMDCQMPEMDGFDATRALRLNQFVSPIIALTANAFKEDRMKCMDAGMSDFLTKPIYLTQLIEVIDRWLAVEAA